MEKKLETATIRTSGVLSEVLLIEDWNGGSGEYEGNFFAPPPRRLGRGGLTSTHPYLHKVVSLICSPTTTFTFLVYSKIPFC